SETLYLDGISISIYIIWSTLCIYIISSASKCSIPTLIFSVCMPIKYNKRTFAKYPTISDTLYLDGISISICIVLDNIVYLHNILCIKMFYSHTYIFNLHTYQI